MLSLGPYQTGLWIAEYLSARCQLCRIGQSVRQSELPDGKPTITDGNSVTHHYKSSRQHQRVASRSTPSRFSKGFLCRQCHQAIAWRPRGFYVDVAPQITLPIQAATYYDYPIRQAIRAFKHQEDMTKLPLLVHVLRQLPRPHGAHAANSVIVAMPTTNPRLIKRGFDPVSILSAQLSKHWGIPQWHGVERIDDAYTQQGLTRAERLSNLDHAFTMTQTPPVKRLLLFDDVATTGASLQALAQACYPSAAHISSTSSVSYLLSAYALAHGSQ